MLESSYSWTTLIVVGIGLYAANLLVKQRKAAPLPPSPKGLPLIGNALDIPSIKEWETFQQWGEEYGDIMSLNILGTPLIVLNSHEHAYALLERRSHNYSDRAVLGMVDLVGWMKGLAFTPYSHRWKETRKLFRLTMGSKSLVQKFFPVEELETRRFLRHLLEEPDLLKRWIIKTAGAVILNISYGYQVKGIDDYIVETVNKSMEIFADVANPMAYPVNVLPILRHLPCWFPGAGFKRKAARCRPIVDDMVKIPLDIVRKEMTEGTAIPSFISEILKKETDMDTLREDIVKWAAGSMYSGGADTTVSAISGFFLAMALHPGIAHKAQAEIDTVVGNDRLPAFTDRAQLPYVEAIVKEVMRWNVVVPLCPPHRAMNDDIYNGYFIPAGSLVVAHIWGFLRNPRTYKEPMRFNPERFLGMCPEKDPRTLCFGFGRRICPGMHLADASVWIAVAMTLAVFDIEKAKDGYGNVIEPTMEWTSGVSHPKGYKCAIKPRSVKAEAIIRSVDMA